jgi:dienelactone hydrolase
MDLQAVTYSVDGKPFTGYLADGSRGDGSPGILVVHEGGGLTTHVKERARMLAELGYVAFAADLFGESNPSLDRAKEIVRGLREDRPALRRRMYAALDVLKACRRVDTQKIAAIGFCFGGMAVLDLACAGADLRCVVGLHPGLDPVRTGERTACKAKVLLCLGEKDPVVTAQQRAAFIAEMNEAGVDWQMLLFGGVGHSFTNRDIDRWGFAGFAYDATADRRSWRAMCDLFEETLGPSHRTGGA